MTYSVNRIMVNRRFADSYSYTGAKGKGYNFITTDEVMDLGKLYTALMFIKSPSKPPRLLWIHYDKPTYPNVFVNALIESGELSEGIGFEHSVVSNLRVTRHSRTEHWVIYTGAAPLVKVGLFNSTFYAKAIDRVGYVINDHKAFSQFCLIHGVK